MKMQDSEKSVLPENRLDPLPGHERSQSSDKEKRNSIQQDATVVIGAPPGNTIAEVDTKKKKNGGYGYYVVRTEAFYLFETSYNHFACPPGNLTSPRNYGDMRLRSISLYGYVEYSLLAVLAPLYRS